MALEQLLSQLGISLTASCIKDIVYTYLNDEENPTRAGLRTELVAQLSIENAKITSEKIIDILAEQGHILITGTKVYSATAIDMSSSKGGSFTFENSISRHASGSLIRAGLGARIQGKNGGGIRQDEDGGISIYVRRQST